jgi:hypothetical protein
MNICEFSDPFIVVSDDIHCRVSPRTETIKLGASGSSSIRGRRNMIGLNHFVASRLL